MDPGLIAGRTGPVLAVAGVVREILVEDVAGQSIRPLRS